MQDISEVEALQSAPTPSLRVSEASEAIHKNNIDCHEPSGSRNDTSHCHSEGAIATEESKNQNICHSQRSEVFRDILCRPEGVRSTTEVSQPNTTESRDISLNAQYDKSTVIASEHSERGNLSFCHSQRSEESKNQHICHTEALAEVSHEFSCHSEGAIASEESKNKSVDSSLHATRSAQNDTFPCHTERSEVSLNSKRDSSIALLPQNDKQNLIAVGSLKNSHQALAKLQSDFIKNGGQWKNIEVGKLFTIKSNPQLNKDSFAFSENGEYPYFTRTCLNNGIAGYVDYLDEEHKIKGDSIAVGMLGMQFFYMKKDFYAGQFTKTLYPKFKPFNSKIAQYFIVLLNKNQQAFQAMLVRDFQKTCLETKLLLPTLKSGEIAFEFMEQWIRELEAERIRELDAYLTATGLKDYTLNDKEKAALKAFEALQNERERVKTPLKWQEFEIGGENGLFELFELKKLNPLDTRDFRAKEKDEQHPIPAVVAKVGDNGIMYYVGKNDFETTENKLVVIGDGAVASGLVYYQGQEFTILHNAYAIRLKMSKFETRQNYLFLACALQKAIFDFFGYENKPTWNKVKEYKIQLPTLKSGEIAFEFMSDFIKAIEKEVIKGVVLYSQKRLNVAKELVENQNL